MPQKKKMTLIQLTFIVAVNMMGSGIIMLPTNMAKVGAISLLSWVVTAIGSMAIAYGFAQAGLFNQRPGGMAAYAEEAYGKDGYFVTFYLYFLSLAIGNVAIAISALGYLAGFVPALTATPIATCIGVIALLWLTTVANFGGPAITGRIGSVTVWGVIIPVGLLSVFGWFWFKGATFAAAWNPQGISLGRGHGLEHRAHALGLPRHGVGGPELGSGGEPEAERAARLHVRHAGRGLHLRPVHHRDPGHRAQRRPGELDGPVRPRLCPDVQPGRGLDHHGPGRDGLRRLAARLAVHARPDREVGRRRADVPLLLLEVNGKGAPIAGMVFMGVVQSVMALSTISPSLSQQFGVLVNLAVVTNVVPYIIALSALPLMMKTAGIDAAKYRKNVAVAVVAILYSVYAIYASGKDAVLGGAIVWGLGYLIWGFLAPRFASEKPAAPVRAEAA